MLKTNPREKTKRLFFPVYDYYVEIIITDSVEDSRCKRDYLIGHSLAMHGGQLAGLHSFHPETPTSYIFLPLNAAPGTITHETFHCVLRMMTWIGSPVENENFAYHQGYIVNEINKFLDKISVKKRT